MIDIKNITKSFGSLQVLKGIDLRIEKGEVVSIVVHLELVKPPCYRYLERWTSQIVALLLWMVLTWAACQLVS